MSRDDNLFSRWSSRKRAVAREETKNEPESDDARRVDEAADPKPESDTPDESEDEILARFGLPSPESLGPGDDFSGFMQSGVPELLRRRALRRLWRSNPVLACVDGLNDYDEDFTSPQETMKVLKTAYKVGRGFLRDPDEAATEAASETEAPGTEETAFASEVQPDSEVASVTPDEPLDSTVDDPMVEADARRDDDSPASEAAETKVAETHPADKKPRRMRFQS